MAQDVKYRHPTPGSSLGHDGSHHSPWLLADPPRVLPFLPLPDVQGQLHPGAGFTVSRGSPTHRGCCGGYGSAPLLQGTSRAGVGSGSLFPLAMPVRQVYFQRSGLGEM